MQVRSCVDRGVRTISHDICCSIQLQCSTVQATGLQHCLQYWSGNWTAAVPAALVRATDLQHCLQQSAHVTGSLASPYLLYLPKQLALVIEAST